MSAPKPCAVTRCIHPAELTQHLCPGHRAEFGLSQEAERGYTDLARYDSMLADFVRRMAVDFDGAVPKPHGGPKVTVP